MAAKRKAKKRGRGRPRLAPDELRWYARLDQETDQALDALAAFWGCSRSEAMRRAVKEKAKAEGLVEDDGVTNG